MAIPPGLQQMLRERVLSRSNSQARRLELLVQMIFEPDGLGLRYDTHATHSVAETWDTRSANCMSFTLLFVALAREAGIPARAQEVKQVLAWVEDQGTIYALGHINAQVRIDGRTGLVDLDSNVLMDPAGPQPISDTRALAHYYNNRGSELMADGDTDGARRYFAQALAEDPTLPDIWNNLGVLDARQGDRTAAAGDYARALALDPRHAATLSNAINLYRRSGDAVRVAQLMQRLERVHASDPFHQYLLGTDAERHGDYRSAVRYYRRAVRLYAGAHQFHFGLARAYFLAGDNRKAERELRIARDLGHGDTQRVYQAKLDSLRRIRQSTASRN